MPNGYMPGLTPGYFLQQQKYMNSPGMDPSSYDPNNFVDPYAAVAMQQQMAQKIFQMQNPRLALPQQFGQALGGAAQQLMRPQDPSQVQQGGQGQQPQTPAGQAVHQKYLALKQQGMDAGQALYQAADAAEDPSFGSQGSQVADHARRYAISSLKFDPGVERKLKLEAQYKSPDNFVNTSSGEKVVAQPGTALYSHIMSNPDQWQKTGDTPQLTPGSTHTFDKNGKIYTYQVDASGNLDTSKKPVGVSTQPVQYGATVAGDDAKATWPGGPKTFGNSDAAETTKTLTDRSISTKNFVDSVDLLSKTATPNSIGVPGDISEKALNIGATVKAVAGRLGLSGNVNDYQMNWNPGLAKDVVSNGVDAEKVKALMLHAALLHESTYGDKNATDSNRKFAVEQQLKIMGEDSSSLTALKATLAQSRGLAISQLNNEFEGKPGVMSKPPWLQSELTKQNPYKTPADVKAAFKQGELTKAQAAAILKSNHGFSD